MAGGMCIHNPAGPACILCQPMTPWQAVNYRTRMFFYHVYDFLLPVRVPLDFGIEDDPFTLPRRPFPIVWAIRLMRNYKIWSCRRKIRRLR